MAESNSVRHLQQLMMRGGGAAFEAVPMALANVITERQWQEHLDEDGKPFKSFEAFVRHKLWWGLESSIDDLLAYCRKREDVQRLIKGEVSGIPEHGGGRKAGQQVDNVNLGGNAATYALRRLKRDRPDLADKVVSGELSANAAAIEAGFRKKRTALEMLLHAWSIASAEERVTFLEKVAETKKLGTS